MNDFDGISLQRMQAVHEALAVKALENEAFMPLFQTADTYLQDMEATQLKLSPVERARQKLRMRMV